MTTRNQVTPTIADRDAEVSVLGSLILNPDSLAAVREARLCADDFSVAGHQLIFSALERLIDRTGATDSTLLQAALGDSLERVGGMPYVVSLAAAVPAASNAAHYAGIVHHHARRREVIAKLDAARQQIVDSGDGIEVATALAADLCAFTASGRGGALRPLRESLREWCDMVDAGGAAPATPTGFCDLDHILDGGLHNGTLNLLAARPSMGKTTLALNAAVYAAKHTGRTAFFSLEMSDTEIITKILAASVGLDMHRLRLGKIQRNEAGLAEGIGAALELPLLVDTSGTISVPEIAGKVRRLAVTGGLSLVIVDYLQLIDTPQRKNTTRNEDVSAISRGLKLLAKDLKIPILALSQLNRAGDGEKPRLSHLRDSGSLEQDADTVIFLYSADESSDIVIADVAKNRMGPKAAVELRFEKCRQRFLSVAREV